MKCSSTLELLHVVLGRYVLLGYSAQRAQYGFIKENTVNPFGDPYRISGILSHIGLWWEALRARAHRCADARCPVPQKWIGSPGLGMYCRSEPPPCVIMM